tara:strand:+ start:859361 stop:859498 length:138 start_codon:yes stop_codon:yes gene_type:complete
MKAHKNLFAFFCSTKTDLRDKDNEVEMDVVECNTTITLWFIGLNL